MYRFAKTGEIADPCGVPRSRICKVPSACCNGADSHRFTYSTTHGSVQCASTALTIRSHGTESKNFSTSRSMTQTLRQHRYQHEATESKVFKFEFPVAAPTPLPACRHRVQGRPVRAVAVGVGMEDRFDLRLQPLGRHRLGDPVRNGGDGGFILRSLPLGVRFGISLRGEACSCW